MSSILLKSWFDFSVWEVCTEKFVEICENNIKKLFGLAVLSICNVCGFPVFCMWFHFLGLPARYRQYCFVGLAVVFLLEALLGFLCSFHFVGGFPVYFECWASCVAKYICMMYFSVFGFPVLVFRSVCCVFVTYGHEVY